MNYDVVIIGGLGHVGLPLGLVWADAGLTIGALDLDETKKNLVNAGTMPFLEHDAEPILKRVVGKKFFVLNHLSEIATAKAVVVTIGTPVDEYLAPQLLVITRLADSLIPHLRSGQHIILRSTVYPGTTDRLKRTLDELGKNIEIAFCPERIAEGHAMEELQSLPQIISSYSPEGVRRCRELFAPLTTDVVELTPLEAELAKLFTNTWRYTLFAAANQFYMLANDHGADYYRIHHAMTYNYPRAKDIPKPGFAAGPCLFKDAMQLAAFNNNRFYLGHAAMLVNEGLPNYLVDRLKRRYDLSELDCGVLGMAFKANSDDNRESLSYKLRKILRFESKSVRCSDVYIREPDFVSVERLIAESDVILLGAPHREYKSLEFPPGKIVVDIWNMWDHGCVL